MALPDKAAVQVLAPKTIYEKKPKCLNYKCVVCNLTNAYLGVGIFKTCQAKAKMFFQTCKCSTPSRALGKDWEAEEAMKFHL